MNGNSLFPRRCSLAEHKINATATGNETEFEVSTTFCLQSSRLSLFLQKELFVLELALSAGVALNLHTFACEFAFWNAESWIAQASCQIGVDVDVDVENVLLCFLLLTCTSFAVILQFGKHRTILLALIIYSRREDKFLLSPLKVLKKTLIYIG